MREKPREVHAVPDVTQPARERVGREPGPQGTSDSGPCASCGHLCGGVRTAVGVHTRLTGAAERVAHSGALLSCVTSWRASKEHRIM